MGKRFARRPSRTGSTSVVHEAVQHSRKLLRRKRRTKRPCDETRRYVSAIHCERDLAWIDHGTDEVNAEEEALKSTQTLEDEPEQVALLLITSPAAVVSCSPGATYTFVQGPSSAARNR